MLDIAQEAAQKANEVTMRYFKKLPKVLYKPDNSPVTRADREAEKTIRGVIAANFPDHGIIGEELGSSNPKARYQWVVDPIDGTKSYVRGIKSWGTLISVLKDNNPIIGVYSSPATSEMFVCQRGKGTFLNGKKTRVSKVKNLKETFIVHSSLDHFQKIGKVTNLVKLTQTIQGKRGAADCDGLNMILKGQADICISAKGKIWDYAAPAILTEEAGGVFSDFTGAKNINSGTLILSNPNVYKQVLNILKNN